MFNQVSVPQSELLSLIAAAKSLGVRGLAEEGVNLNARLVEITLLLNSSLLKYLIPQQQKVTTYPSKIAIYCPQGSGTLRQQLLMMH